MSPFAEVIKGLYFKKLITEEKVNSFLKENKITVEEHLYILGKEVK